MPTALARRSASSSQTSERIPVSTPRPRVLIEDWLPVAELGIESKRERKVFTDLPPLNYLHIWWARRPIVASEAVLLAGLMPAWTPGLAERHPDEPWFRDEARYRSWLLHLVGIWGDPVRAAHLEASGIAKGKEAFGYPQAWKNSPSPADVELLQTVLRETWGELPSVIDPTAGGGAIPFAATRFGLPAVANDLNSVAATVLLGGVGLPSRFGAHTARQVEIFADRLAKRLDEATAPYFPTQIGEEPVGYLYAYEIACPRTSLPVPLFPNMWLDRAPRKAVRITTDADGYDLSIVEGSEIDFDPNIGTLKNGVGISPYDGLVIDKEYIKQEAASGRMVPILYAVAARTRTPGSRRAGALAFRLPTTEESSAVETATRDVFSHQVSWERDGLCPAEHIGDLIPKHDIKPYGFLRWTDMFAPRQLITHVEFVRAYREIIPEVQADCGDEAEAVLCLLTLMHGKMLDYNSRLSAWNLNQHTVQHGFESHAFSFKSTFAEKATPGVLLRWAAAQVIKAYTVSANLMESTLSTGRPAVRVTQGSATDMRDLPDGSITSVCIDPPYYDNVMYGELSDLFHVWHRRTFGQVRPDLYPTSVADQENEAVANVARFVSLGKRRSQIADADYEAKMTSIFNECRRIMWDDGLMTVMFTHKRAEAWDTLGMGLLQAGFTIETSWPVNTEFEYSTHQAQINAAASTIMLVCRKRKERGDSSRRYLEDIESDIREAARSAANRFQNDGIEGVDLLLSTYGPTLSVISQAWPVYSSTPDADGRDQLLRPEDALEVAREEVVRLRRSRLIGATAQVDDYTDFVLLSWDVFRAREIAFDTARLLALAVGGMEIEDLVRAKILGQKGGSVVLLEPQERLRRDRDIAVSGVRPDAESFAYIIDAVDTVLYVAELDGMTAAKRLMDKHSLLGNGPFVASIQGLVNAIPRTKTKGEWFVKEAGLLDTLCTLYLADVVLPPDDLEEAVASQGELF